MDLGYNFFDIEHEMLVPAKGRVLIAEPFLDDSYFKRSIIFLTEHNEEGTVGFVLNKPVSIDMKEILVDMPPFETMVSVGGPVGTNTVHYIHTAGDIIPNSVNVYDGISWGGDFDVVKELIKKKKLSNKDIRFFLGYSGWQPTQLENELKQNSWIVSKAKSMEIMNINTQDLWKNTLKGLGKKYELWANFPENPGLN